MDFVAADFFAAGFLVAGFFLVGIVLLLSGWMAHRDNTETEGSRCLWRGAAGYQETPWCQPTNYLKNGILEAHVVCLKNQTRDQETRAGENLNVADLKPIKHPVQNLK